MTSTISADSDDVYSDPGTLEVLHFRVQETLACLDLSHVSRVFSLMSLKYIPGSPPFVAGLMNLHGKSVSVIDLGMFLGLPQPQPYAIDTPVVLCSDGQREVGLLIDEIYGVEAVLKDDLQMQRALHGSDESRLDAVINTHRGLSLLLDVENLLQAQIYGNEFSSTEGHES